MKIGLIDVDGHNFPNLALMRISSYHKKMGDRVSWYEPFDGLIEEYDKVYMSKVFSNAYSKDYDLPIYAKEIHKGGTGYCISLDKSGKEVFDKTKNVQLPIEIEKCFPDYSIYPQYDFAVSMTSRGCPRGCQFCHVAAKEGKCAKKVADVSDFWNGQKEIKVLDPNITAVKEKRDLLRQYRETKALIDFTQGIDIRLVNEEDIEDINQMKIKQIHFAWDNPKDDLYFKFRSYSILAKHKPHGHYGSVYCLCGFNSTMQENLYRIYTLRDLGFDPYVMIYNKPTASMELKNLQRYVNNKIIFRSVRTFEEYNKNY